MDKFLHQLEESITINELLKVVNKKEKRKRMDYFKYYIPYILSCIVLYTAVVLFIVFVLKDFISAFVLTFSIIFILFAWGMFDKYISFKIFKIIRQKEIEHFSNIKE